MNVNNIVSMTNVESLFTDEISDYTWLRWQISMLCKKTGSECEQKWDEVLSVYVVFLFLTGYTTLNISTCSGEQYEDVRVQCT